MGGYIEKELRGLFSALLLSFIIFGVSLTIIGATLPKIISDFNWSYVSTGIVLSAGSIGYFASSFISGILLHKLGPRRVITIGLALQFLGLLFFALTPFILINLLLNLMIGFGQGGTEVVVNFSVVRMEKGGRSRLMNLMHAAFSVGAVVGPYIVIMLMNAELGWQAIYRLMSFVSLIMAVIFWFLPFNKLTDGDEKADGKVKIRRLISNSVLILSFLILFIYVGSELGVSNWVSEYYVKYFGSSVNTGALMVSIFWIGLLIGRLGTSFFYKGSKPELVALGLATICTISLTFALLIKSPFVAGIGFCLAGLGYSAIYPLIMALVGRYFSYAQGAAVGFAATGGGIGSFVFPFIMSAIAQAFGIHNGFFFYIALNILMVSLILAIVRQARKSLPANQ
ncbi:MAG: MFS transporter [Candidatus Poribacteria bacterium]